MKRLLVIGALALVGCVSTEPSESQLRYNEGQCTKFGYRPGTKDHADCQKQLAIRTMQTNEARRAQAHAAFTAMAMTPSPTPQFSPVYTGPQQTVIMAPQPTLTQTVNTTMGMQRY